MRDRGGEPGNPGGPLHGGTAPEPDATQATGDGAARRKPQPQRRRTVNRARNRRETNPEGQDGSSRQTAERHSHGAWARHHDTGDSQTGGRTCDDATGARRERCCWRRRRWRARHSAPTRRRQAPVAAPGLPVTVWRGCVPSRPIPRTAALRSEGFPRCPRSRPASSAPRRAKRAPTAAAARRRPGTKRAPTCRSGPAEARALAPQASRRAPAEASTSNTRGVRPVRAG